MTINLENFEPNHSKKESSISTPKFNHQTFNNSKRKRETIKNIYIGLPNHLANRIKWVARKYRTNPLSFIPGGCDIVVEYHEGKVLGYDWIKKPSAYVRAISGELVGLNKSELFSLNKSKQLQFTTKNLSRVFARLYSDKTEREQSHFLEVWNHKTSNEMPWESLKTFEEELQQNQF